MRLDFLLGDYFSIDVKSPSVSGVTDSQFQAAMKCGNFAGTVDAWVEPDEVKGFIASLKQLNQTLRGEATLTSDDGGRTLAIEMFPTDQLGHFLLRVKMGKDYAIHHNVYETQAVGVFPFETQALASICEHFEEAVTGHSDA